MKKLLLCFTITFSVFTAFAQTPYVINQNHNGCCGGGAVAGSSFLTLGAGQIDSIKVYNRTSGSASGYTVSVFLGNTTTAGGLLHAETKTDVVGDQFAQPEVMIRFSSPVHVNAATTYTFYVDGFPIRLNYSNVYADGTYWNDSGEQTGSDLDFVMYIGQITTGVTSAENGDNMIIYKSSDRSLSVANAIPAGYELSLYDTRGNLISAVINSNLVVSASAGVYIARLQSGNTVYTTKIVVQ